MSRDTTIALLLLVGLSAAAAAITISKGNADAEQRAVCHEALKNATASDSLRVYRLQPKCLP